MNTSLYIALLGSLSFTALSDRVINFSPGPTFLHKTVEKQITANFNQSGFTSLALSHWSPEFLIIFEHAIQTTRKSMKIPDYHEVMPFG